jgi:hypothetical protein
MSRDFALSDELVRGFQACAREPRPLLELVRERVEILDDLPVLPDDAKFAAVRGSSANLERLAVATNMEVLWVGRPTLALQRTLARLPRLRAIHLCDVGKVDLAPLGELVSLEHLLVSWAGHLIDISWLDRLPKLRTLYLENMKRLDLETLPELPKLEALQIGGTMWSALKVPGLGPLSRLPALRYLLLSNVRPLDGSLVPLHSLERLRELQLPNFFAVEECARLAAALPEARGAVLTPFFMQPNRRADGSYTFPCKRCGGPRLMLTGRPASLLCPTCDATRIARRVARWEVARSGSA